MRLYRLYQINELYKQMERNIDKLQTPPLESGANDELLSDEECEKYLGWLKDNFDASHESYSCYDFALMVKSKMLESHFDGFPTEKDLEDFPVGTDKEYIPLITCRETYYYHLITYCKLCSYRNKMPSFSDYFAYTIRNGKSK